MGLRRAGAPRVMLVAAAVCLLNALAPQAAHAAASHAAASHAAASVVGPPAESAKVTLDESSIDGPAVWTISGSAPNGPSRSILAWTGTDSQHHLNYMSSADGLRYSDKHIVDELSFSRPAVTEVVDFEGGPQLIVLAWTGVDAQRTLNVLYINAATAEPVTKLTLQGETSFTAPAVAAHCCAAASELKLAWVGTDPNHTLNVITISAARQVTAKTILRGRSSDAAPYLDDASPVFDTWLLSWVDPNRRFNFAQSAVRGSGRWMASRSLAEWSGAGPSMIAIPFGGVPSHWLAWSGTFRDTANHLNVQFTESFPAWPADTAETTFAETCLGGPELGDLGVNGQTLVAWTGTDPAHSLNVAIISVRVQ